MSPSISFDSATNPLSVQMFLMLDTLLVRTQVCCAMDMMFFCNASSSNSRPCCHHCYAAKHIGTFGAQHILCEQTAK